MSRLINADALKENLKNLILPNIPEEGEEGNFDNFLSNIILKQAIEDIDNAPAVDAENHGHWIKVGGYATPGGDPVWCCSECGKGLHVYGVEHNSYGSDIADHQWVACPNCGARMVNGNE